MNNKIYLPYCGIYTKIYKYFLRKITNYEVITDDYIPSKKMTINTKLNQIITALNKGCYYILDLEIENISKYYYLLITEILEKNNYNFSYIKLIKNDHLSIKKIYDFSKQINSKLTYLQFFINYIKLIIGKILLKSRYKSKTNT